MIPVWWSIGLTLLGGLGWLLVTLDRRRAGFTVGLVAQVAWATYAVITGQWGFLGSVALFGAINALGLWRLPRGRRAEPTEWIEPPGLDPITGRVHDVMVLTDGAVQHTAVCWCRPQERP